MRSIVAVLVLVALAVVSLLCLGLWRSQPQNETRIARGDALEFADFAFAVEGVTLAERLGQPSRGVEASGRFVCIDLRVMNHRQDGDYSIRDRAAVLVDALGRSFRADAVATRTLRGFDAVETTVPPGSSRVTHLAFDVPADATGLRLHFDLGSPLMNLLDAASDGHRTLALE
jgi:hypothetical protein